MRLQERFKYSDYQKSFLKRAEVILLHCDDNDDDDDDDEDGDDQG